MSFMCTTESKSNQVYIMLKDLSSSKTMTELRWIDNNIQIMVGKFPKSKVLSESESQSVAG